MPIIYPRPHNHSIIDAEHPTELARLLMQDRLLTDAMGGLFPEYEELPAITTLLDVGCGPGSWALSVAHASPKVQVTGIDISEIMVRYARASAWTQGLDNADFRVMDATRPLDIPAASFDLVNIRFAVGFLTPATWPPLLRECCRICRPGGIVRLTECEMGVTSSPALQHLGRLVCQALSKTGRSFSPDGLTLGIVPMLKPLLLQAGLTDVRLKPCVLESSVESEWYYAARDDVMAVYPLLKPFLVEVAQVVEAEVFEALYQQAMMQMYVDGFVALTFVLTAWGRVPHTLTVPLSSSFEGAWKGSAASLAEPVPMTQGEPV